MSFQAVAWAIEVRVGDPILKTLLMTICHHADRETWVCWPSQDLLAHETEVSKRTIQRKLEELQEKGFIRITKRRRQDGTQDNSMITVTGRQIVTLSPPVDNIGATGGQKPGVPVDTTSPPLIQQEEQEEQSVPKRSKNGTRIPDDWQITPDLGNYARSKGLTRNEVLAEAEKFVNYWRSAAGAKARKLDWDLTWKGWAQRTAERLGRTPHGAPTDPPPAAEMDRDSWTNISRMYANSSNWHREWGPEPGHPRCLMPADLQQPFVTGH